MNSEDLFHGEHLVFRRRRGWEYVEHRTAKESVMVLAQTREGAVVLVEEFRPAVEAAVEHAVAVHKHQDSPQLRQQIRSCIKEGTPNP